MIREQAHDYLQGSGFSEEQIKAVKSAFVDSALADIKAEIRGMDYHMIDCEVVVSQEEVLDIIDNIGKGE